LAIHSAFLWPIIALGSAEAIALLAAARSALRGEPSALAWLVAAVLAVVITAAAIYTAFQSHPSLGLFAPPRPTAEIFLAPVTLLLATTVVGAWLARRRASDPPRGT
jgi:hypothetical protein